MARTSKDSRTYWRDREIEHAKSVLKDDKEIIKKLNDLYNDTAREIEKEINTMLSNYASKTGLSMADVKKRVSETDIRDYERKAARYVREKNFSDVANEEMAIYNLKMKISRLEMIQMHIDMELTALTDGAEKLIYDRIVKVGMDELKRQSGILGENFRFNREGVEYIAKRKFHGEDFSTRLWTNKNLLHDELQKRLAEAITKGQNPRVAARKLRQTVEQSVFNSERLLITETARVQSEVQMELFREAEFEQFEFITTESACDVCGPLDGKIFNVDEGMPGENMPPMHPFCKCSTAAYMDREEWDRKLKERGL